MVKTQVTEFFISQDLKFEMNFPVSFFIKIFRDKGFILGEKLFKNETSKVNFPSFPKWFQRCPKSCNFLFSREKNPITLNKKYVIKRLT